METSEVLGFLYRCSDQNIRQRNISLGIHSQNMLGVSGFQVKELSKEIEPNHELALNLWKTGILEARIVSSMIDIPMMVNEQQMESWVREIDSWYLCDQVCLNLFWKTSFAYEKALQWSYQGLEYVKRAAFVMMALMAIHDQSLDDEKFIPFLSRILDEAEDSRPYVHKGLLSALRKIGKRSPVLHLQTRAIAIEMLNNPSMIAKRMAVKILSELESAVFLS